MFWSQLSHIFSSSTVPPQPYGLGHELQAIQAPYTHAVFHNFLAPSIVHTVRMMHILQSWSIQTLPIISLAAGQNE